MHFKRLGSRHLVKEIDSKGVKSSRLSNLMRLKVRYGTSIQFFLVDKITTIKLMLLNLKNIYIWTAYIIIRTVPVYDMIWVFHITYNSALPYLVIWHEVHITYAAPLPAIHASRSLSGTWTSENTPPPHSSAVWCIYKQAPFILFRLRLRCSEIKMLTDNTCHCYYFTMFIQLYM